MHYWKEATEILTRCNIKFTKTEPTEANFNTPGIFINGYELGGQSQRNRIIFYFNPRAPIQHFSDSNFTTPERKEAESIKPPYFHNQLTDKNFIKGLNNWLAYIPKVEKIYQTCFDRCEAQAEIKNKILSCFLDFGLKQENDRDKYNSGARFRKYDPDLKMDLSFYNDKPAQVWTMELGRLTIEESIRILSVLYSMRNIQPVKPEEEATP